MVYVSQLLGARGLLRWNQADLAKASGLALSTISRMESIDGPVQGHSGNVWRIQRALEDAGIEFIDENGGGPGVRLKNRMENSRSG